MLETRKAARNLLPALLLAGLLASVATAGALLAAPSLEKEGSLFTLATTSSRYSFDAAWRTESLWSRCADGSWRRDASPEPVRLDALRRQFLIHVGRPSLEAIPAEGQFEMSSLKSLGYI